MRNLGTSLQEEYKEKKKQQYNEEPVYFCKHCLSLKILNLDNETSYCDNCGSTEITQTDIESWEDLYELKYNKKFK